LLEKPTYTAYDVQYNNVGIATEPNTAKFLNLYVYRIAMVDMLTVAVPNNSL